MTSGRKWAGSWLALLLSILVGLSCYLATARSIERDSEARFSGNANNAANTITARIKSFNDVVRSTGALFHSNYPVSKVQFHDFVTSLGLDQHFPAIESFSYAEMVADRDRALFERRMRTDPLPPAAPPSKDEFTIDPPGRRPFYLPVSLIYPVHRYRYAGTDLAIEPVRLAAFFSARDTGQLTSSGIPLKRLYGSKGTSMAVRLPVYERHAAIETVAQRRRAFLGVIGISFSVDALVRGVIDEMPIKNARMILVDHEPGPRGQRRMLVDTAGGAPAGLATRAPQFTQTLPIAFNGRQWFATFSVSAHDMYTPFEEYLPWLAMLAGMTATLLLYALIETLLSSRRRAIRLARQMTSELRDSQTRLQVSHENLRRLAAHADSIKEVERKRIAREIHDDLGQNLLVLRIDADMLAARTKGRQIRLHQRAAETLMHIDSCIKSVRQIINNLRPNVLDLGLSAAVEWQVGEFQRRTGLACELVDETGDIAFNEQVATGFLRILQESLTNIVRHAHATQACVALRVSACTFSMTISDDGVGLPVTGRGRPGSFGLIGIEERIGLLGGTCSISNAPGGGAIVAVSVPLSRCEFTAGGNEALFGGHLLAADTLLV